MKIDMSSMNTEDIEEYNIELSDIMTFYYEVTLPYGTISNIATEVSSDGNTLTWDFTKLNNANIEYEFDLTKPVENNKSDNKTTNTKKDNIFTNLPENTGLYLIIGGSAVLVITIIIFIILKKKNK